MNMTKAWTHWPEQEVKAALPVLNQRLNSVVMRCMNEMVCELLPEAVQLRPAVLHIKLLLTDGVEAARLSSSA